MGNSDSSFKYSANFIEPRPRGYIYIGLTIDPPSFIPFVRGSEPRDEMIEESKALARRFETLEEVIKATVYEAVLIPPIEGMPRFDVILLIQTTSSKTITKVQNSKFYKQLNADFVMAAHNIKRIGDTEQTLSGPFLFNHFTAENSVKAVDAFEKIAGWYTTKIGVDNITLLQPIDDAPYVFINYVRLQHGPIRFMFDQFTKPSFITFVRAKLRANNMVALPLICNPV